MSNVGGRHFGMVVRLDFLMEFYLLMVVVSGR